MSNPFDGVTFSGCGTLNFFQAGVAASLQRAGFLDGVRFAGASAGSGLATLVAAGVDAEAVSEATFDLLEPFEGQNLLRRPDSTMAFARRFLATLVDEEVYRRAGDRVHISITSVSPLRNWTVRRFHHVDDLRQAIRASCHLPSWRHRSVRFRGRACFDGGFSSNTPLVGERCLTVSPFPPRWSVDIAPSRPLNPLRAVIVPDRQRARALFQRGLADGDRYLERWARGEVALRPKSGPHRVRESGEGAAPVPVEVA